MMREWRKRERARVRETEERDGRENVAFSKKQLSNEQIKQIAKRKAKQ